jgi:hypothetical protein
MTQPALAFSRETSGDRIYRHPVSGLEVPSVTTIIGTKHTVGLERWKLRMVAEAAVTRTERIGELVAKVGGRETTKKLAAVPENIANRAAEVGDEVHKWLEAVALGEDAPAVSPMTRPFVNSAKAWLDRHQPEFLAVEASVFGEGRDGYLYAGTFDFVARVAGRVVIGDWKTSRSLHEGVAMQLGALSRGTEIVAPDGSSSPMFAVETGLAVHIRPEGAVGVQVPLRDGPWRCFCGLLAAWWEMQEAEGWLGEELR